MEIKVTSDNLKFFQCFSSETKLKIIELLQIKPRNIGELANLLNVSSTIITRNINALEKANIIKTKLSPGKRGLQKRCYIAIDEVTLLFDVQKQQDTPSTSISIPIGQYSNYCVTPTCGIASAKQLIGIVDDPRYFSNPECVDASILWFNEGFVEYIIPSYIFSNGYEIESISLSFELCSEFPGYKNDYLSDIYFYLDNISLGFWTCPGDFGDKKGTYTPSWWHGGTEYGLLKTICINEKGTYIDGSKMSNVTLESLNISSKNNLTLKIASPSEAVNSGGITLFGKNFGNYNQDINIRVNYKK